MASLSVRLNQLNLNGDRFDCQKIPSPPQERLASSLSTFFLKDPDVRTYIASEGKKIDFDLIVGKTGLELCFKGKNPRSFHLENSSEASKAIDQAFRYYQNAGSLPRAGESARLASEHMTAARMRSEELRKASIPGVKRQVMAGTMVAENTLSLTRNILFAIPSIGPDDSFVNYLGYYAGSIWTLFSLKEMNDASQDFQRAKAIGDKEGLRCSTARLARGGLTTVASIVYMAGRIFSSLGNAIASAAAIGSATGLFGVASLMGVGMNGASFLRAFRMNNRLNEYLNNKAIPEVDRLRGALAFLKDCVAITAEERREIIASVEKGNIGKSPEEKQRMIQEKIEALSESKVKYIRRRTSNKALQMILDHADELQKKLSQGSGIEEAKALIGIVKTENKKRMTLYGISVLAAAVSFVAMILLAVGSFGALPFILYAVSSFIYLLMAISALVTQIMDKANNIQPLEDSIPNHHRLY